MPPKRAHRSRSRQTTPLSPPKQIAAPSSLRSTRRARSTSHENDQASVQRKQLDTVLSAVHEEPDQDDDIEIVQQPSPSDINVGESAADDRDDSDDDDFDDATSNGTTQLEALDIDAITDSLPVLYQASARILAVVRGDKAQDLVEHTQNPLSTVSKRLRTLVNLFTTTRQAYGGGSYIDIRLILRKLTDSADISDGPWRPDSVLQLANLSHLVADLSQHNDGATLEMLDRMYNSFPEPFCHFSIANGLSNYGTQLVNETIKFGIALNTQFFLRMIDKHRGGPSFDPDMILQQTFFNDEGQLRGGQIEGEDLPPELEEQIIQRLQDIRKSFRKSSKDPVDLKRLRDTYTWPEFLKGALQWVSQRKVELESQITAQGGIDAIQDLLERKDFTPYKRRALYAQATSRLPKTTELSQMENKSDRTHVTPQILQGSRGSGSNTVVKRAARLKQIQGNQAETSSESDEESLGPQEVMRQRSLLDSTTNSRAKVTEIPQSPELAAADARLVDEVEQNLVNSEDEDEDEDEGEDDEDDEVDEGRDSEISPGEDHEDVEETEEAPHEPDLSPPTSSPNRMIPTQQTLAVLKAVKKQAAIANKENVNVNRSRSYNDRQLGAQRLQWDESQTGAKRRRQDRENDDSDDEFETDTRAQKRARHPRQLPQTDIDEWIDADADEWLEGDAGDDIDVQASQQLQKDARQPVQTDTRPPPSTQPNLRGPSVQERSMKHSTSRPPPSSALQPKSRAQNRPPQTISSAQSRSEPEERSEPPSGSAIEQHREANAEAKERMRQFRADHIRPASRNHTENRRAWTIPETERLFDLIGSYGCKWAQILAADNDHVDGPRLQHRGQVQLKDKARNVKMDYLKGGKTIPRRFKQVTIRSSDKKLLDDMGLPYC